MKKLKIDWLKAKEDFLLDGCISLKEVALKYGLSYSKIKKISAKREWYRDKKEIQRLISDALVKEAQFKITEEILKHARRIKPSLGERYLKGKSPLYRELASLPLKELNELNIEV